MKKISIGVLIFSFFLLNSVNVFGSCAEKKSPSNNAIISIQKAQEYQKNKEIKKAIKTLTVFIIKNKKDDHHYIEYMLGSLYLEDNNSKKAMLAFEESAKLCPDFYPAWQNIGKIAYDLKEYYKAATSLEKAYYLSEKRDKDLLFAAAMAYRGAKKKKECFELLRIITEPPTKKKNHINAYVSIGIDLKKHNEVLKRLNKLIDQNKENAFLLKLAANTALSLNDYRKAANYLTIYYMVKKDLTFKEYSLLGNLYRSQGAPFKAIKYYEKALSKKEDLKVYESAISSLISAIDYDRALEVISKAEKKYPEANEIWKLKGMVYYEKEDFDNAYEAISKSLKLKNKDRNSAVLLAYCAGRSGRIKDAKRLIANNKNIKYCKKAIKILNSFEQMEN